MSGLVQTFESAEAVPEDQREFAVQVGEQFILYDVDSDPRVVPLRNAIERVKGEAKGAKEKLAAWGKIGIPADEVTASLEELETLRASKGKGDEAIEARVKQVQEKYEGQVTERDDAIRRLSAQLDGLLIDDAATKAILAEKGNVELLLPHVKAHSKVEVMQDGRRVAVVVDQDGNPRIADVHGTPLGFDGLLKEMKKSEAFQVAFEGTGVAGGGSGGARGSGAGSVRKRSDLATDADKTAFIKEHGLEAYQKLSA